MHIIGTKGTVGDFFEDTGKFTLKGHCVSIVYSSEAI